MGDITDVAIGVSTYSNYTGASFGMLGLHFTVPQTIQPGQFRFIRVTWLTDSCSLSGGAVTTGTDQLDLEVQVGLFSREEDLNLGPGYQLSFPDDCPS